MRDLNICAFAFLAVAALGQSPTSRPEFDVASIKRNHAYCCPTAGVGSGTGGGHDVTLKTLISVAYHLPEFQISGGPSWINLDTFDVEGKTGDRNSEPDRLRLMLQALLADRFRLSVHREKKESPVYELAVNKGGPKFKASADQSPAVDGPAPAGAGPNHGAMRLGAGSLFGNAVTMSTFVNLLSQRLGRPVMDKTSLTGRFDIQMQWTPEVGESPVDPTGFPLPVPAGSVDASIFSAIQEQLGLRLETAKAPVEVLVIDHAERPSEN